MGTSRWVFDSTDKRYKNSAIKAAKDLGYGQEVIEKIEAAKNDQAISTIMYVEAKKIGEK